MRAGITNNGRSASDASVISHESASIATNTIVTVMTLLTTEPSVFVNACCAPMMSLLSRLTNAPVCVRVKNAMGMRCTCANTWRRRSKISDSPMRADT